VPKPQKRTHINKAWNWKVQSETKARKTRYWVGLKKETRLCGLKTPAGGSNRAKGNPEILPGGIFTVELSTGKELPRYGGEGGQFFNQ